MKKIFSVFRRDFKIALKDPLALWIAFAPILLAFIIVLISPGISDTTFNFAILDNVDSKYISTMEDYVKVEVFDSMEDLENRVMRRDEVIGIAKVGDKLQIIAQGNESENSLNMAKGMNALYEIDAFENGIQDSKVSFLTFNEKIPPLKQTFSVSLLLMITVISAMIIALGLVDEKVDKTIKAASVTPMKQSTYILSKSIIGLIVLIISSIVSLLILGMVSINWGMMFLMLISIGIISIIIAYVVGLSSSDFIEAAGSIKALMLPLMASILVFELCNESWHFTVMWSPFYWAYKGINEIISHTASWGEILLYCTIIWAISLIIFKICTKFIRKALS